MNIMKRDYLLELMRSDKTVFTIRELSLMWDKTDSSFVRKKLHRYAKSGKLFPIRRGIYAKVQDYDRYELAVRIYSPAYISFETVLADAGIIFQYYSQIFVATYQSREIECNFQKYSFIRMREEILTNPNGLKINSHYSIASPERAFLDTIYHHSEYYFDNLTPLDWNKVYGILPVYGGNKRMDRAVRNYYSEFKKG
jgi:predicted transcriptional regulator of viral defense system